MLVGAFFLITNLLPEVWTYNGKEYTAMGVFGPALWAWPVGLRLGW